MKKLTDVVFEIANVYKSNGDYSHNKIFEYFKFILWKDYCNKDLNEVEKWLNA